MILKKILSSNTRSYNSFLSILLWSKFLCFSFLFLHTYHGGSSIHKTSMTIIARRLVPWPIRGQWPKLDNPVKLRIPVVLRKLERTKWYFSSLYSWISYESWNIVISQFLQHMVILNKNASFAAKNNHVTIQLRRLFLVAVFFRQLLFSS